MYKKPIGFARSRGRPPNGNPNLLVGCTPMTYEHCILQVHLALVSHEKSFAVKLRWGDKPRIRDDTAALRLLLARVETYWPKLRSDESPIPFGSFWGYDEGCSFNFHRNYCQRWAYRCFPSRRASFALYSPRDWIEITCAGEFSWKPVRDNDTTASFERRLLLAARWGGRGAPAGNGWPKLFASSYVPGGYFQPFAARDWINLTCTRESTWKLVRDNDTTASFERRLLPAARRCNRGATNHKAFTNLLARSSTPEDYFKSSKAGHNFGGARARGHPRKLAKATTTVFNRGYCYYLLRGRVVEKHPNESG